jgi:hypothetical protein
MRAGTAAMAGTVVALKATIQGPDYYVTLRLHGLRGPTPSPASTPYSDSGGSVNADLQMALTFARGLAGDVESASRVTLIRGR